VREARAGAAGQPPIADRTASAQARAQVNGSLPAGAERPARRGGGGQSGAGSTGTPARASDPKGPSKNRLREQRKAEQAIEAAETALSELEDALSEPAAWATQYESAKSQARHTAARRAVEEAYARLEGLID